MDRIAEKAGVELGSPYHGWTKSMTPLTSRQRMLRALNREACDHVPCCFMSFTALRKRVDEDLYALVEAEQALGLDSMLFIPTASRLERPEHPDLRGLPVRFAPQVRCRSWREDGAGGLRILHREFQTSDGVLSTSIQITDDWPYGDQIPFVGDYCVPRALRHLVTSPADLPALAHLLAPPTEADIAAFAKEAERARAFACDRGVLLAGGWGVGADMLNWLCGMEQLMILTHTDPEMVAELFEMVHQWNKRRMAIVLSAGVDLYIRRAWYEGCDFIPLRFFRDVALPKLKVEVELAHENGAKFGYICSSGLLPVLDYLLAAGVDVLIGLDPVQGTSTNLAEIKAKVGDRMCLWGGVSGAITVEMGSEEEIRSAVQQALRTLGTQGFILSPVDNITVDAPKTWSNLEAFRDEWKCQQVA
jgi:uroporphyrinogen-III decarboxylase